MSVMILTGLEELNLTDNQLTALPPAIGNLASLNLSDNQLTVLTPEMKKPMDRGVIELSGNPLRC